MKLNSEKTAQLCAEINQIANEQILGCFETMSAILRDTDDSDIKEKMLDAIRPAESYYNDEYLPVLEHANKIMVEQIPELEEKIKNANINLFQAKSIDVNKVKSNNIDFDGLKL